MLLKCFNLFYTFLKLGFLSFGGGYAMLSMIMTEAEHFSVSPAQFADLNALDMVVPGAIAINAATYVGYLYQKLPGAIAATAGVSLPSFVLTVVIMRFFAHFKDNDWLTDTLSGIKPAALLTRWALCLSFPLLFLYSPQCSIYVSKSIRFCLPY